MLLLQQHGLLAETVERNLSHSFRSVTIYLGFASSSTRLFNSQSTGEAPQLSPVYGQYDNGASGFSFYDNFAGTSLSSQWKIIDSNGSYSVNNGLVITSNSDWESIGSISNFNPQKQVIDSYSYFSSFTAVGDGAHAQVGWGPGMVLSAGFSTVLFGGHPRFIRALQFFPRNTRKRCCHNRRLNFKL